MVIYFILCIYYTKKYFALSKPFVADDVWQLRLIKERCILFDDAKLSNLNFECSNI